MPKQDHTNRLSPDADTIAALATPPGPGGVSILRISGPQAWAVAQSIFQPQDANALAGGIPVRELVYGHALDPASGERLDEVFAVFFAGPRSYTTEDVVELQGHAGPAVGQRMLGAALAQGCRLARPGEFTSRAFLGGRVDLSQAEAVARLVDALSQGEARLALSALEGGLAKALAPVREALLKSAAALEAAIDFPEDELEIDLPGQAKALAQAVIPSLRQLIATHQRMRVYQEGAVAVICGRPNVGKSSLFNALLGRDRAIVTSIPGTTRDTLAEKVLLGGVSCRLVDTAGLGEAKDMIEGMGMERAQQALGSADLAILVLDGSEPLTSEDQAALKLSAALPRLMVVNKSDLPPAWDTDSLGEGGEGALRISALTGESLETLIAAAAELLTGDAREPTPGEFAANARQAEALGRCLEAVERAAAGLEADEPQVEFISLDLAAALAALGEVDGLGAPDEVIEAVFRDFCVGK